MDDQSFITAVIGESAVRLSGPLAKPIADLFPESIVPIPVPACAATGARLEKWWTEVQHNWPGFEFRIID